VIARLCTLALVSACLSAQTPAHSDVDFYSKEKRAALGARLATEVRKQTSAIPDSAVHDYLERLGRRLAAQLRVADLDWEFAVVGDDVGGSTHEALSLPGGHIFVPASLILAVDNEAELAGMLAHSMAPIAEGFGPPIAARGRAGDSSNVPLVCGRGWTGMGAAGNGDRAYAPEECLKIWRSNELAADRVAVHVMAAAGYEPAALLDYIRRTQRDLAPASVKYSVLPPREIRIGALETAVANLPSRSGPSGGEFGAIQDRVRELAAPSVGKPPSALKQPPSLRRADEQ
jgi:predicted Zn-dependent protease